LKTEVVEIDERFGQEYAGRYKFVEISWSKRSRIIQRHTKYSQLTGQVVNSDYVSVQAETIWASLKEQPPGKPVSLEKLLSEEENGVPIGIGELFSQIVNRLNNLNLEETVFLSEQSEDKNPIRLSPTSDCAKNSAGHQNSSDSNPRKSCNNSS
jgi:hypothetical protein